MSASTFIPLQHRAETLSAHLQRRAHVRGKRGRGKAVSWPPEDQICQVRFFLSNDLPSSICAVQSTFHLNHLKSLQTHSRGTGVVHAPPGFHASIVKRPRVIASMSSERSWLCPEEFTLDNEWLVADGSDSSEAALQRQRELRVLEAFYPRLTSIPDSPAEPAEICVALHDNAISVVPSEEEDDESNKELEDELKGVGNGSGVDEPSEHGKLIKGTQHFSILKASLTNSQEPSWQALDASLGKADSTVAASAAAAAATAMAFGKCGTSGFVDPDLLAEILRNPALLKSLTSNKLPTKSPTSVISGHEVCSTGQFQPYFHPIPHYDAPRSKACTGIPLIAGLPSPVSVLSDWTHDHAAKFIQTMHLKPSENANAPTKPSTVSCPSLAPPRCPCTPHDDFSRLESAPVHGLHAWADEARVGQNALCIQNVGSHTPYVVHVERSSGTMAPLAPFPAQKGLDFRSNGKPGRVHFVQSSPCSGATQHQGIRLIDSKPCKFSQPEARLKSNESCGLSTKAGPRTTRLCMYFNTPRGCRNGQYCAFIHQSGSPELNTVAR